MYHRDSTGRLVRTEAREPELPECCSICYDKKPILTRCPNHHLCCQECIESHIVTECEKVDNKIIQYMQRDHYIKFPKLKIACCPFLQACGYNTDNTFDLLSILRSAEISENTAKKLFKTKQTSDRFRGAYYHNHPRF